MTTTPTLDLGTDPALAETNDGFVAYSASYDDDGYLEALACRRHPPDGPPDRIALPKPQR